MGKIFDEVNDMLTNITANPDNVERLVELATESAENNRIIAKSAIHYEYLGDQKKYDVLKRLILRLEELESEKPEVRWEQNIPSTLFACLNSWYGKEDDLSHQEKEMHDWRVFVAIDILSEIADKRSIKVIGPMMAASENGSLLKDAAGELLSLIEDKPLGKGDPDSMRMLIRVATAKMSSKYGKGDMVQLLRRIIDENENDLIHFVGPLIATCRSPEAGIAARELLESMEDKRLGKADEYTMKELIRISCGAMKNERIMRLVVGLLRKVVDENENDLIYFVGPLVNLTQYPVMRHELRGLLEAMDGKRFGKCDSETMEKTATTFRGALNNGKQRGTVKRLMKAIIEDGESDLIYFVPNLLVNIRDSELHKTSKELLDAMDGKKLGKGNVETIRSIAKILVHAIKNKQQKESMVKIARKIIDEGENDLIYFVGPLIYGMQDQTIIRPCIELLNGMKDKKLGKGDGETAGNMERLFRKAVHNPRQGRYVGFFMNKLEREEGIRLSINGARYESPSWNGTRTNGHNGVNRNRKNRY